MNERDVYELHLAVWEAMGKHRPLEVRADSFVQCACGESIAGESYFDHTKRVLVEHLWLSGYRKAYSEHGLRMPDEQERACVRALLIRRESDDEFPEPA